jgi:hypothetical protein
MRSCRLAFALAFTASCVSAPRPALAQPTTPDLLTFTASDATRAGQLNSMLRLHLTAPQNLFNTAGAPTWAEWIALASAPVGNFQGVDLIGGAQTDLGISAFDDQGYFWGTAEPNGWAFPTDASSGGRLPSWTFNTSSTQGWTLSGATAPAPSGGTWTVTATGTDPQLLSPALSLDPFQSAYIQVVMATTAASTQGQLYWQTSANPSYDPSRSLTFPLRNDGAMHTYMIPVYRSATWTGTVTKLRLDPILATSSGQSVAVTSIATSYDRRQVVTNANYILAEWRYFMWSNKVGLLRADVMPKARNAIHYLQTVLGGDANSVMVVPWNGHDALQGLVGSQPNYGHGIQESYWDVLSFGYKDAFASVYYYAALSAMSQLELAVERNPGYNIPPNPYGENSSTFASKAASVLTAIRTTFWQGGKRRLMMAQDTTGATWDFGMVPLNLEAIYYGAVDGFRANLILTWVNNEGFIESGDTSQGADIYHWPFAPRVTTLSDTTWYTFPYFEWFHPIPAFGAQVQNGGADLFTSFFDVVDRVRNRGADNGWTRLTQILDWYQAAQNAGGYRAYYPQPGVLQGCGTVGALGIDCEFIESGLVPLSFLYGFLGIGADVDGLDIYPALPSTLSSIGVQRLFFQRNYYDVTETSDPTHPVQIATRGSSAPVTLPVKIGNLAPNQTYTFTVSDLAAGTHTTQVFQTDGTGTVIASLAMPAQGEITLARAALNFYTVTPCRVLDTRSTGVALSSSTAVNTYTITGGSCGIPASAAAVAFNFTGIGYGVGVSIQAFPGDQSPTGTNVLSFRPGQVRAGQAVVGLATSGAGTLGVAPVFTASGTADFLIDVAGYFAP